jgi:aminoglycoside phosphotransferase (APT) family kinase protein
MPVVLRPLRAHQLLRTTVRERFGAGARIHKVAVERLNRRVLRYVVTLSRPGEAQNVSWSLIGKVYESADFGRRGFAALRQLWANGFGRASRDGIHIPEPYAYQPEHSLLLMEDVPGQSLKALLKRRTAGPDHIRLFATAAAKLHQCPVVLTDPSMIDDYLARSTVNARPEALAAAFPDLAADIAWVLKAARDAHCRFGEDTLALCHGDPHPDQFLIADGHLWILDLDRAGYGDPMHDLALVFVSLRGLESKASRAAYVRDVLDQFLAMYFPTHHCRAAARIPLYAALIHLKRACKLFRWQDEPTWEEKLRRQVRHAVSCMAMMQDAAEPRSLSDVVEIYRRCPPKA